MYRIDPSDNNLTLLVDDFKQPNGLAFSVDQKKLYVNDSGNMHIRVFDDFTWGDADLCSLYIPASHTLPRTNTPGIKLF